MTWQGACTVHEDVCADCGAGVKAGSDNGDLPVPAGGQKVICLRCVAFGRGLEEAEAPALHAAFEARADVRRRGAVS